jgi:hypothetical protein
MKETRKTCKDIIATLEQFAKRSEHITIRHKYCGLEFCQVQMNVSKNTKVVKEMVEYLKSRLAYHEVEYGAEWFKTSENCEFEDGGWCASVCVQYC